MIPVQPTRRTVATISLKKPNCWNNQIFYGNLCHRVLPNPNGTNGEQGEKGTLFCHLINSLKNATFWIVQLFLHLPRHFLCQFQTTDFFTL